MDIPHDFQTIYIYCMPFGLTITCNYALPPRWGFSVSPGKADDVYPGNEAGWRVKSHQSNVVSRQFVKVSFVRY